MLDRLRNELAYQKQARPESTVVPMLDVPALEWSLAEIERLRAMSFGFEEDARLLAQDNKRLRKALHEITLDGPIWRAQRIARETLLEK